MYKFIAGCKGSATRAQSFIASLLYLLVRGFFVHKTCCHLEKVTLHADKHFDHVYN